MRKSPREAEKGADRCPRRSRRSFFFFFKREKEKTGKRGGLIHRYTYDTDNVYLCVNGVRRCVCAD